MANKAIVTDKQVSDALSVWHSTRKVRGDFDAMRAVLASLHTTEQKRPERARTSKPEFYFQFTPDRVYDEWVKDFSENLGPINGATVFIRQESESDYRVAIARCSYGDQFCRKTGREIARRRYFLNRDGAYKFDHKPTYEECLGLL